MCPEPALLVAYLDGTLFSRDATAIDQHIETCADCTKLVADMRRAREAERTSNASYRWIGASIAAVAIVGAASWLLWPASSSAPRRASTPERRDAPSLPSPAANAVVPEAAAPRADAPAPKEKPDAQPRREAAADKARRTEKPIVREAPRAEPARVEAPRVERVAPAAVPTESESGVVLRGRNANRRVLWRARETVIEHSTDGGMTWVTEHTADRAVRAGAFVDANVAWLVGDNGLILRRTRNGWFGTTPPAEGNVTGVRASSPSKATVTLEDGRAFSTENGGVTWSPQ